MRGYPKTLNTKADYEYVRKNFPPEMWRERFESLLTCEFNWFNTGELAEGQTGITDDTHKIEQDMQQNKRYQYEWRHDPNCELHRVGYTEAEVQEILK